jgi:DNA-binding CsgD family transcriptional regulator
MRRSVLNAAQELSIREKEVLDLLGAGKTPVEIAGRLRLREKTIRTYYDRIKQKLGAANVYQVIRLAVLWREGKLGNKRGRTS